jgi:hypothetical protein
MTANAASTADRWLRLWCNLVCVMTLLVSVVPTALWRKDEGDVRGTASRPCPSACPFEHDGSGLPPHGSFGAIFR